MRLLQSQKQSTIFGTKMQQRFLLWMSQSIPNWRAFNAWWGWISGYRSCLALRIFWTPTPSKRGEFVWWSLRLMKGYSCGLYVKCGFRLGRLQEDGSRCALKVKLASSEQLLHGSQIPWRFNSKNVPLLRGLSAEDHPRLKRAPGELWNDLVTHYCKIFCGSTETVWNRFM